MNKNLLWLLLIIPMIPIYKYSANRHYEKILSKYLDIYKNLSDKKDFATNVEEVMALLKKADIQDGSANWFLCNGSEKAAIKLLNRGIGEFKKQSRETFDLFYWTESFISYIKKSFNCIGIFIKSFFSIIGTCLVKIFREH